MAVYYKSLLVEGAIIKKNGGILILQTKHILEGDWDILIVLDACRYDMFDEVSKDILKIK